MAVCLGIVIGIFFNYPTKPMAFNEKDQREQKLRQIIRFIDYEYVDAVNSDSLLDETIASLLEQLDPHSTYIPHDEVIANEESISGSFVGIGIEFKLFKDSLTVVRVMAEGPSERAGLKSGQRILKADTIRLVGPGLDVAKVVSTLKGESGTRVELEIYDPLSQRIIQKTVKRGEVPVRSVQSAFLLNDSVGLIKLVKFTRRSAQEVEYAMKQLKRAGAEHLILDLRDNPGGLMTAAEKISDEFLEDDKLIVFTKNRSGEKSRVYATKKGQFEKGKVAVLINGGSASASEIVAGALQDNDRGLIVGRRSFGKGLVQEEITLNDGSRMRLTTQRYYTPTGRSIQKDYNQYDPGFLESHNFNGQIPLDTNQKPNQEFLTPAGRTVYGGGGIMPDLTVKFDSSSYNQLLYHLAMTTNMDEKAFTYVDAHRSSLNKWKEDEFVRNFEVDSNLLAYFYGPFEVNKLSEKAEDELPIVKNRIKAFMAYNLFGNEAYQKVYSQEDIFVKQALQGLKSSLVQD